ncbi:MAG: hypothetical protein DWQ37_20585 [Planctomycetota bacterium]|nr:MAG: hypothetical protein DWQ37_20585 [Planctomycetota bacterium]
MSLLGSAKKKKKKKGAEAAEGFDAAETAAPAEKPKKKAKAPATRGIAVEKPKANIYTAMLALSLVAMIIGCVVLYVEWNAYQ